MKRVKQALSNWSLRRLIWLCLGMITVIFLVSQAASMLAAGTVTRAIGQFSNQALPPQSRVAELIKAYLDQETGQRGFLLTGNPISLEPYFAGRTSADRLVTELNTQLDTDGEASRNLAAVIAAAQAWTDEAAEPQIAARREGSVPPDQLAVMTIAGKSLFDRLRVHLSALQGSTDDLVAERFDEVRDAQQRATIAQVAAALLLLAALILSDWLLRHLLTRPVARTLEDVTTVAAGDHDRTISGAGLREIAVLAAAAESMRDSLRKALLENERVSSQRADAEVHYRFLADNAVDVIAHLRGQEVVWISRSAENAFGWPTERWIGSNISDRIHPDDLHAAATLLGEVSDRGWGHARLRIGTVDDDYHWVETHGKSFIDDEDASKGVICSFRVVDEQVAAEQLLESDRGRFEAVTANTPSAVSITDLEHRYTVVNDAYCELFGAESVRDVIGRRENDLLPSEAFERSRLAVDRLVMGDRFVEEELIRLGTDDGIWVMTQRFGLRNRRGDIAELVAIRTDITHRKQIEREAAERVLWEERVQTAISEGRLLVYTQPIVDIATAQEVEEELLVRLRAPSTGQILAPSEFLPQCQRHGLMPVIDQYMVERAIEMARAGRTVCVNISAQTIGNPAAMKDILEKLSAAGPDLAKKLVFEITETTALTSLEIARSFSRSTTSLGCRVALDDFGTGYGAFTELRNLDLDVLKIDLSFVQNMLEDPDDERVVRTIIFVARQYGLTTVAEGVETEALLRRLAELGVDRAQGYLFGKPTPIAC